MIIRKKHTVEDHILYPSYYFSHIEITKDIDYNFFNSNVNIDEYDKFIKTYDKKYSILQYNFNNYEIFSEPEILDPECEYVYVTDNPNLRSNKWKIIVDPDLEGLSPFDKCYRVRYNLFKYCTTPVCIYIDAAIRIFKSLRWLYNEFENSNADIGLNIHPVRNKITDEYNAWVMRDKKYSEEKEKVLKYMADHNYDFDYKGLYQGTMRICRNTELNRKIDSAVLNTMLEIQNNPIVRVTQTIYSYILNSMFNYISVYPIKSETFFTEYMYRYNHGSNAKSPAWWSNPNALYLFNEKLYI